MRPFSKFSSALTASAAIGIAGCGDQPTGPASVPEAPVPLALSVMQRGQIRLELLFAGERSMLALQRRAERDGVVQTLQTLAERIDANDSRGVERALAAARAALARYQTLAGEDPAALPDLEALMLTLDQVAALATAENTVSETRRSSEERQP